MQKESQIKDKRAKHEEKKIQQHPTSIQVQAEIVNPELLMYS